MTIGNFLLTVGLVAGLLAGLLWLLPIRVKLKYTKLFGGIAFISITLSASLLMYYQLQQNFQYSYVYQHISTELPLQYRISALWAGQEGSFLLWAMICTWVSALLRPVIRATKEEKSASNVMGGYWLISSLIILMTLISQPFELMAETPFEGQGLTLALQDPWMVVHPPLVFIGYTAMAVLFCLNLGQISWLRERQELLRKWTLISWLFLGAGILTGSMWAYRALGWGGYWAWDPIENAALIPWLLLTSMFHRFDRGFSRVQGMLPFTLAVFGTFLARSGILKGKSAHAYTETTLALPIVAMFITLVVFTFLVHHFGKKGSGKEQFHFSSYLCLIAAFYGLAGIVLIGTIMPLFTTLNIDQNYYNAATLLFCMICVALFIRRNSPNFLVSPLLLILNTIIILLISLTMKFDNFGWLLLLWFSLLPIVMWGVTLFRPRTVNNLKKPTNPYVNLVHTGVLLLVLGTICSSAFAEKGTLLLMKKDPAVVKIAGELVNLEKRDTDKNLIIHKVASDIIIESSDTASATPGVLRYTIKPLIGLFWLGGFLMLVGGMGALFRGKRDHVFLEEREAAVFPNGCSDKAILTLSK